MITKITIMLEDNLHPLVVKEFTDRLERTFGAVDYIRSDGIVLIETKKDIDAITFPSYVRGFEACIYDVSIHTVDNTKEEYWDELGDELGFVTADKYLS